MNLPRTRNGSYGCGGRGIVGPCTHGACWLIIAQVAFSLAAGREPQLDYVIVFDAGSSGTRIHVFNVLPAKPGAAVRDIDLAVRDTQTKKWHPGLSRYARNADWGEAQRSIRELLNFAGTLVPTERRASTPVLFKATAGLRGVPLERSTQVMQNVRHVLSESEYRFQDSWAEIIPGKAEGGLAWVAANYLYGTFYGEDGRPTLGVIEMGGGSTQVTFLVDADTPVASGDLFEFSTLNGYKYRLFAHSYQGYGADYASNRMRHIHAAEGLTQDPCFQHGDTYEVNVSDDEPHELTGSGDAEQCIRSITDKLLTNSDGPGNYEFEVPLRGDFVAIEVFVYVRLDMKLEVPADFSEVRKSAISVCQQPKRESIRDNICIGMCLQEAFIQKLSTNGSVTIQISPEVRGSQVEWALGAALVHVLSDGPPPPPKHAWWDSFRQQLMDLFAIEALAILVVALVSMRFAFPRFLASYERSAAGGEASHTSGAADAARGVELGTLQSPSAPLSGRC